MARRLPVYLLLDTSGSMIGEPIEAVKYGLQTMLASLRQDPSALETVHLSIITFDTQVQQLMPLTELEQFRMPDIVPPQSGATFMGKALEILCECYDREIRRGSADQKGDWKPLLFIMTDGSPSDIGLFREMIPELRRRGFGSIVGCAAGHKAKVEFLKELTDSVLSLDTADGASFRAFFKWVSDTINAGNRSQGTGQDMTIPPPPPEIGIVI